MPKEESKSHSNPALPTSPSTRNKDLITIKIRFADWQTIQKIKRSTPHNRREPSNADVVHQALAGSLIDVDGSVNRPSVLSGRIKTAIENTVLDLVHKFLSGTSPQNRAYGLYLLGLDEAEAYEFIKGHDTPRSKGVKQ